MSLSRVLDLVVVVLLVVGIGMMAMTYSLVAENQVLIENNRRLIAECGHAH